MKFSFLKLNRNRLPDNTSLRPLIFNVNLYWALILLGSLAIFIFGAALGFKFFNTLYSEGYKKDNQVINADEILDIKRLENNIKMREKFIATPREVPRDPSI